MAPSIFRHEVFLSRNSFAWLTHILPYPSICCIDRFRSLFCFFFFGPWLAPEYSGLPSASLLCRPQKRLNRFCSFTIEYLRNRIRRSRILIRSLYREVNSRPFGDLFSPKQQVRNYLNTDHYVNNYLRR